MALIGSHTAPRVALERTASAIASARRAVLADRHAIGSLSSNGDGSPISCRSPRHGAISPRARSSPMFSMNRLSRSPPPACSARDVGAALVWSGTRPRKLLGFFPARVTTRRYGIKLPVLVGWTHPYAPLGAPLVERETAEPVIAAWLAHLAADPSLPALVLLPLLAEDGPFAQTLGTILQRGQLPCADFAPPSPGAARAAIRARALRRTGTVGTSATRAAPCRPALDRSRRGAVYRGYGARRGRRRGRGFFRAGGKRLEGQGRHLGRRPRRCQGLLQDGAVFARRRRQSGRQPAPPRRPSHCRRDHAVER